MLISLELLTHKTKTFIYNCPLCNNSFSDAVDLKSHKESHISRSNQNRLACNICEQLYPRRGLLTHMKSHKTGVICNICNAVLANQTNLKGHIARKHSKNERERCSFEDCKTEFYAEYRLGHIKRKHSPQTDAMSFVCPTCDKNYITSISIFGPPHPLTYWRETI